MLHFAEFGSVRGWSLHTIDDQDLDRTFRRFELPSCSWIAAKMDGPVVLAATDTADGPHSAFTTVHERSSRFTKVGQESGRLGDGEGMEKSPYSDEL